MTSEPQDKILGCLFGQAIGDALGLGTEFMSKAKVNKHYPQSLKYYEQIIEDSHRRGWAKGAWTDDTYMMLCILQAYNGVEFSVREVAQNFKNWFNTQPMGIGSNTFNVLCMGDYVEQTEFCARIMWDI